MRKSIVLASVFCLALIAASPAAAAKSSVTCTGVMPDIAARDVTVPAGASCTLVDSSVRNDVRVNRDSYFQATNTDIGGNVFSRDSQTVFVEAGSGIGGTVETRNTAQVYVFNSFIGDEVDIYGASDQVNVCGNRVRWDIEVTRSGQDILVGDPSAVDCAGNRVLRGDIEIEKNSTDVELVVSGNRIVRGDLEVLGNKGTSVKNVLGNKGGDTIVCRDNASPFAAAGQHQLRRAAGAVQLAEVRSWKFEVEAWGPSASSGPSRFRARTGATPPPRPAPGSSPGTAPPPRIARRPPGRRSPCPSASGPRRPAAIRRAASAASVAGHHVGAADGQQGDVDPGRLVHLRDHVGVARVVDRGACRR